MYIARAFAKRPEFFAAVANATRELPHGILTVTPTLGTDWDGEPAVFFQVILADGIPISELARLTRQLSWIIFEKLDPLQEWGVLPYYDYRTQSEEARRNELSLT